jgi:hypothetical protein
MINDASLLQAALVGYQNHLEQINEAIADIRKRLGQGSGGSGVQQGRVRRELSATARKRIAAAQKKRWAAFHKQKKALKA